MTNAIPQSVHLVGSIGLDNVPDIFRTLGKGLGRRLKRVPDGEVGGRRLWVSWQYPLFRANPFLAATDVARPRTGFLELKIADGVDPKDIVFGELGYAREARASYLDFLKAKECGELPPRRAVPGLPADPAGGGEFILHAPDARADRTGLRTGDAAPRSLRVCEAIPHKDLCAAMGHLHRDGVLGWPGLPGAHQAGGYHRGDDSRAHAADLRRDPGRCRARHPSLLRRFRGQALRRAARCRQDGRVRQRARQARSGIRLPSSTCRFPSIGPMTPSSSRLAICGSRDRHRSLSGRGPWRRWQGWHQRAGLPRPRTI